MRRREFIAVPGSASAVRSLRRFLRIAIALTGLLWPAVCFVAVTAATAEPKRVLLLNSFGRDFASYGAFAREFRAELDRKSPEVLEFFDAALMTERFGAGQNEGPFVDYLQSLFAKRPLDLITVVGAPAVRFVQQHRSQLFPSMPVLYAAVEERRVALDALAANETVVAVSTDFAAVVKNILRVLPETTDIAVVVGNSPNEQYWLEQIRLAVQPQTNQITFTWLSDLSFDEILKRAATLPPKSAIFYYQMSVDAAGRAHEGGQALASLRAAANAPIFTGIDTYFGRGIVGGSLLSVNDVAQQTAGVAMRILNGEAPSGIKTPPIGQGTPKYDWRELQRWSISESRLPPGSEIWFRNLTVWEQYWRELSVVFAAVLLQSAMIGWLLFERQRRHRAELESRNRFLEVIHLNRTAAAGVLSASFSHELNQPLGAILSNAEAAELLVSANPPDVGQIMEILADIRRDDRRAAEIINHLGGLLKKQSPVELQELDLSDAVRRAVKLLGPEASSRDVVLDIGQGQAGLPVRADEVHLQQVILNLALNAMDAMQNCVPGSRKITLETVLVGPTEVEVSVADTGPGIPNDKLENVFDTFFTTKPHGTGLGLSIARTIIANYGGRIWAENKLSGGAVFRFTLPLARFQ